MKKTKSIPRKRRELPYHATSLLSMWDKRPRAEHNKVDTGKNYGNRKFESPPSGGYEEASGDEVIVDPRETVVSEKVDNVWFGGDSMLIRLEAIDEVNFDSLLSTIRRLNKDWEITKVIGESFLKIYI
jgi:hypothetical protein